MALEPQSAPLPQFLADLLAAWQLGADADTDISRPAHGTNNQTFLVTRAGQRFVLRISENLILAQVQAEQRLLRWLSRADLPFAVPEPVAATDGKTVIETSAGPATLSRWLPGVPPDFSGEAALERFGRAVGVLGQALQRVPPADAPQDWLSSPLPVPVDGPDGEGLWRELRAAGVSGERAALLARLAARFTQWWAGAVGALPVQVVHGDLAASNVLADPETGRVSALLDFEIAGADLRVQDFLVALYQSGALEGPAWPDRAAAFARGHASARALTAAEVEALPELLVSRLVGSVLWRAARRRRGQARLAEVMDRIDRLETTMRWLAAHGGELVALVGAQFQDIPLGLSKIQLRAIARVGAGAVLMC